MEIATIAQAVAVISACWAIISGVGAWKREFIGKRQIELAEQLLAKFFEVKDAIAYIRSPFSSSDEGKSRRRSEGETREVSALLDRAYIVVERYEKRQNIFTEFNILKYKCIASFGTEIENIFMDTNKVLNSIFVSAEMLGRHYWQRQGYVSMAPEEFQNHLDEMHRHESIFWEMGGEADTIRRQLQDVQVRLEAITAPCFKEPMTLYSILTKRWMSRTRKRINPQTPLS
jgi:hypothetical protein